MKAMRGFVTRYGTLDDSMRTYVDPNAENVLTKYKAAPSRQVQVWPPRWHHGEPESAAFYCPYIPLITTTAVNPQTTAVNPQTMAPVALPPRPIILDVEELRLVETEAELLAMSNGEEIRRSSWWFILRCKGYNFTPIAREAFDWLMSQPRDTFELSHTTLASEKESGISYGPIVLGPEVDQRHVVVKFTSKDTAALFKLFHV
jgi:hypothetical protein